MQFTGTSSVELPRVREFYFLLDGIKVSDTGVVQFLFSDTGNNSFPFTFSGGFIQTDRVISTYNLIDESTVEGYITSGSPSGILSYKVNGVFFQKNVLFSGLNKLTVSGSSTLTQCNVSLLSNPINYLVRFAPTYLCYSGVSGSISSDVSFITKPASFTFYNSNKDLLTGYDTGLRVATGTGSLFLNDIDPSFMDYSNTFEISLPTTFGDIGGKFSSERTGVSSFSMIGLSDSADNEYHQASLFDGSWSGSGFAYANNVLTYNFGFNYSNLTTLGEPLPARLSISFVPLGPLNNAAYEAQYITGFSLADPGLYDLQPVFSGAQYYYVTGLQNPLSSFLFSSGCSSVPVNFVGGNPSLPASGLLTLKSVRISGIYGAGVNTFKIVSGYSGASYGSGYQYAPEFVLTTGGGCYSLPDASGVELAQFKRASGLGAIYAQAAGLTGEVLWDGQLVSGVKVTNIGMGYGPTLPPTLRFIRDFADPEAPDASGDFLYKRSGVYDFDQFWKVYTTFNTTYSPLSGYNNAYSGNFDVLGAGKVSVRAILSGLDNTAPVSGGLTVVLSGNGKALTGQWIVSQSRIFDLSPDAMTNPEPPSYSVVPLPDLSFGFEQDQSEEQYISDVGQKVDNIIEFNYILDEEGNFILDENGSFLEA